ncbi:MAG: hypothetical protein M3209_15855 [Acidobacteriota bacterium]|nr:hypothetical protein [Acidobacteriota bacterium]
MNKLTYFLVATLICVGFTTNAFAQRTTTLYLNVTIDDSVSAASGVQSDDPDKSDNVTTPYQNGVNSVQAAFNSYGHFVFNSGARSVSFIYSLPQDETNSALPADTQSGVKARTFPINSTGYIPMQKMAAGTSQCLGLGWELAAGDIAGSKREIGYHYFRGDLTNTAYVTVTRSQDGSFWTMEPANRATCGGNNDVSFDNIARVRDVKTVKNKTTDYDYGRYFMPFKLVLSAR